MAYNIIVYDGLKTSSSHVDLTTTSGTPTSMLSSIALITAGKVTLNVNDVLNKLVFDPSKVDVVVAPVFLHLGWVRDNL